MGIVREWFDRGDVDAVLELNNSAIALAMNKLTQQKDKVHLNSGAVTSALTGAACTKNMVHWTYDSWMLAHGPVLSLTKAGLKAWYIIAPDYAFGAVPDAGLHPAVVEAQGGKVLGVAKHPFPGVTDFSSYPACRPGERGTRSSRWRTAATDIVNCMKQAHEFGLPQQRHQVWSRSPRRPPISMAWGSRPARG